MPESSTLVWNAYEHEHIERGSDWFWALGIAAVSIALISVLLHDALFGVLIVLAAGVIAMLARRPPALTRFELSERGIRVGDTLHRYEEIISFWVEDETDSRPLLLVDTTKLFAPNLIIPIEGIEPGLVRAYLQERVDEVRMHEPMAHKMLEFFGL